MDVLETRAFMSRLLLVWPPQATKAINSFLVGHCSFCLRSCTAVVGSVSWVVDFISLQPCLIPSSSLQVALRVQQNELVESGVSFLHMIPVTAANRSEFVFLRNVGETNPFLVPAAAFSLSHYSVLCPFSSSKAAVLLSEIQGTVGQHCHLYKRCFIQALRFKKQISQEFTHVAAQQWGSYTGLEAELELLPASAPHFSPYPICEHTQQETRALCSGRQVATCIPCAGLVTRVAPCVL